MFARHTLVLSALVVFGLAACASPTEEPGQDTQDTKEEQPTLGKQASELRRSDKCTWDCEMDCTSGDCIMVCRGSGPECNGKSPW